MTKVEAMTRSKVEAMTRPIIGIENRTAQETFDIMCDRIRTTLSSAEEVQPVAVVVGHHVTQGPNVEFLTDNLAVGTKLYVSPTSELDALRKRVAELEGLCNRLEADCMTECERAATAEARVAELDKALERIIKVLPGDEQTDTVVTATNRLNAVLDIARSVRDGGKVDG